MDIYTKIIRTCVSIYVERLLLTFILGSRGIIMKAGTGEILKIK